MKKFLLLLIVFLGFAIPSVHASELLFSETTATATTTVSGTTHYGMRFFGINPPNYVVDRVGVYVSGFTGAGATATFRLLFRNAANTVTATSSAKLMTTGWNYFDYPSGATLSVYGNDMRIDVERATGTGGFNTFRTARVTASPTLNWREYESSGSSDSYPLMEIYGIDLDNPVEGGTVTRIISQDEPDNGELTPDDIVNFQFTFYNNDTDEDPVTFSGVDIRDLSSGFEYTPLESPIIISGEGSFSQIADLVEGHFHMWRPYLRNASSTRIVYGSWYSFDVVSYSGQFDPLDPNADMATSTVLGRFFSQQGYLANKFPFAYFYDVAGIVGTINDNMTETNFPTLSLNMASSSLPMGSLTFLSKDTVEMFAGSTAVALFRTLMSASLWLFFAYAVYAQIKRLFHH